jgi:hypothetical protein
MLFLVLLTLNEAISQLTDMFPTGNVSGLDDMISRDLSTQFASRLRNPYQHFISLALFLRCLGVRTRD